MKFWKLLLALLILSKISFAQKEFIISGETINKSLVLADSGQYKPALALLEKISKSDTNYVTSLLKKAMVCRVDSQFAAGIKYCKEALQLKANHQADPELYNVYGTLLLDMGKFDEAIAMFDTTIAKYPSFGLPYFNKGVALLALSKPELAETWFQKALLVNPYLYTAHHQLALSALRQGKIVPAYLGYLSYLLFSPDGKYAGNAIAMLQHISTNTEDIVEFKNARKTEPNANFQAVEDVLFAKIALDKSFKLASSLDDPITRQIQAVLEKIEYSDNDHDFYIQYYLPFLKKAYSTQKFDVLIHHSFSSVNLPAITTYTSKNKKQIDAFTTEAGNYFDVIKATRELIVAKRDAVTERYFFENGVLIGKGTLSKTGKGLVGNWESCYAAGNTKGKGSFDSSSERTGRWVWYYPNGQLKAYENYLNGKLHGQQEYFYFNGNPSSVEMYVNGDMQGPSTVYHYGGGKKNVLNYSANKIDGENRVYFTSGVLSSLNYYKAGELHGAIKEYHKNGKLKAVSQYTDGKPDGLYKLYSNMGTLIAEGTFVKGESQGNWKYYDSEGKLKKSVYFEKGLENGLHQEYHSNGQLSLTLNAVKDKIEGELLEYYTDGKLLSKQLYANGVLTQASYLNGAGKQLSELVKSGENAKLVIYDVNGFKGSSTNYNKLGQRNGADTVFYSNGKISQLSHYTEDAQEGKVSVFFHNGKLKSETTMEKGNSQGYYVSYYMNGNIASEGWLIEGVNQGPWAYYDEDGKLNMTQFFLDGEIDGYKAEYQANGKKIREYKYYRGWLEETVHFDANGETISTDLFTKGQGKFRQLYPNGKVMTETEYKNGEYHGVFKAYFFDGSPEMVFYYNYGELDSTYVAYHHGGLKSAEGNYKYGERNGLWKFYNEDGKLSRTSNYKGDLLNGDYTTYFPDGKIDFASHVKDDLYEGISKKYDRKGALAYQVTYVNDNPFFYTYNDATGKLKEPIPLAGSTGTLKTFFANGKPSRECSFVGGFRHGNDRLYHENGTLRSEDHLEYNIFEGPAKTYFDNGKLQTDWNYLNDNLHGICKSFYPNGTLKKEEKYEYGVLQGPVKTYNEAGKLLQTKLYERGVLISVKHD